MTTVVDSLVVSLGLDATKFNKEQNDAIVSLRKFQQGATEGGKATENAARRSVQAIGGLKTQVLELFSAVTGVGIISFIKNLTESDVAVGKLSRATGVSVNELSKWQAVARITGGSAQEMGASFKQISDVFTSWQVGGPEGPPVFAILSRITQEAQRLDAAHARIFDATKGQSQYFKDLADNLKIIHDLSGDKNLASYLAGKVGVGADLFDVLQRGAGGAQELLDIVEKIGVATDKSVDSATELSRRWNAIFVKTDSAGRQSGVIPDILWLSDILNMTPGQLYDYATGKKGEKDPGGHNFPAANDHGSFQGAFSSKSDKEAFIRAEAQKRGIDPNVAMKVAQSEGFNQPVGDNGTSFGAFQLHVTPGGRGNAVGDQFRRDTGLDPSDPKNEARSIMYALDNAKKNGWHDYHGAARVGVGDWGGIDRNAPNRGGGAGGTTMEFNGPITVTGVKDANDFTQKLRDLGLKRQAEANQSSVGGE